MVKLFIALLTGGLLTSFAEFKLKYNLFDYLDDAIHGIEKVIAKVKAKLAALKAKL